jgi:hypothetical protein
VQHVHREYDWFMRGFRKPSSLLKHDLGIAIERLRHRLKVHPSIVGENRQLHSGPG